MKHIVCDSGGHSSAIVAIEVARRFGKENTILLNHDINPLYEDADIKRFKADISAYIGIPITYANYRAVAKPEELPSQFKVCIEAGALTDPTTTGTLCTSILKTIPFDRYLMTNFYPYDTLFATKNDCIIYYGFDIHESRRIQRRSGLLAAKGYKTDFPMLWKGRTIYNTKEIGIEPPMTYEVFKHANCFGCLKAGLLHWYVVYVIKPFIYEEAIDMEEELDFTIHTIIRNGTKRPISLLELGHIFERMKTDRIPVTEHQSMIKFAHLLRKYQIEECNSGKPCECLIKKTLLKNALMNLS